MFKLKDVREDKLIYFTCKINREERHFRFDGRSISEYIDRCVGWKDINTQNNNQEYDKENMKFEKDLIDSYYYHKNIYKAI